jgi:predicted PurR-regulated permease PerM
MLAILSGGELLGIPGALLAVPVLASVSVVVDEIQRQRLARHGEEVGIQQNGPEARRRAHARPC